MAVNASDVAKRRLGFPAMTSGHRMPKRDVMTRKAQAAFVLAVISVSVAGCQPASGPPATNDAVSSRDELCARLGKTVTLVGSVAVHRVEGVPVMELRDGTRVWLRGDDMRRFTAAGETVSVFGRLGYLPSEQRDAYSATLRDIYILVDAKVIENR